MRRIFPKSLGNLGAAMPPPSENIGGQPRLSGRPVDAGAVVGLAIEVWRLQRRLTRAAIPESAKAPLTRSVERIAEALSDIGVETRDPEGERFREGMSWDVVAFEPPGEVVRETLRPAVFLFGHLATLAQVIVGPQIPGGASQAVPAKGLRREEKDN